MLIGQGAQGAVYGLADGKVAKVFQLKEDCDREVEILKRLRGFPYAAQLLEHDHKHTITLHNGGRDLLAIITEKGGQKICKRVVCEGMVAAVTHLHRQGVVHGDIKLENMLWDDARLRLCDFGCARYVSKEEIERIGRQCLRARRGSLPYAAPEMFTKNQYDGFAADVWSLGVSMVAFQEEALPFSKANCKCARFFYYTQLNPQSILHNLSLLLPGVGEWDTYVSEMVPKCLQVRPEDRVRLAH